VNETDNLAVKGAKAAGDFIYDIANDPYTSFTGETLGGENTGVSGRENAIAGTVAAALGGPFKVVKGAKTLNMGQYMKGRRGVTAASQGENLRKLNNNVRVSKHAARDAKNTGKVIDAIDSSLEQRNP
jgi:hypothetical protein